MFQFLLQVSRIQLSRMQSLWIVMLFTTLVLADKSRNASVTWDLTTGKYTLHDDIINNSVANAVFTNEIFQTGWSYLEVKTSENYPDSVQAYAAGLVEGYLTKDLIKMHWHNTADAYCDNETIYCTDLKSFLDKNLDFINNQIQKKRSSSDYWHQVGLVLEQLSGVEDGYHNVSGQPQIMVDPMGLMRINLMGDFMDLEGVLNRTEKKHFLGGEACSAMVKILPGNSDIYFAHNTWTTYNMMLRILKKYDLALHQGMQKDSPLIPGRISAFSSQPGLIASIDDFYLLSSGLVAVETSIPNTNTSLWKYVTPRGTIMEWIRNIVANRLATNGKQWTEVFGILNSGTYNNQWMILDYNKFFPGQSLQDDLLWVLEQLPGYIHSEDVTQVLRNQGYWPSYNVPYFKDIFNLSGGPEAVEEYGDYFTYDKTSRALIFKRDHSKVENVFDMIKLMRYNDFEHDPLARCNCTPPYSAANAIASRCDLNLINGTYPIKILSHIPLGAIDMKMTTSEMFKNYHFVAFAGPTYDSVTPFQWSRSDFDTTERHEGHPDLWTFDPIIHKWQT